MSTLMQASRQWSTRPSDERFTSLYALRDSVKESQRLSKSGVVSSKALEFAAVEGDMNGLQIVSKKTGQAIAPTNWAFGQVATRLQVPAAYMRKLPAEIAALNLNYAVAKESAEDIGVLVGLDSDGTPDMLKAATGPKYGRVWNSAIADSLVNMFGDGVTGDWRVPGEFRVALPEVTKANTTLYASDRDMFVFLADETNRLELPNRRNGKPGSLARGVFVWNSEVGSASFGMAAFLYDEVCKNRIVWGATEYRESRFRHTASAPDKWLENVAPLIEAYSQSAATPYEAALIAAQNKKIDDVSAFMMDRFNKKTAHAILAAHVDEENRPVESLWDAATAVTAYAKGIAFQDERVAVERVAGKILDLAM